MCLHFGCEKPDSNPLPAAASQPSSSVPAREGDDSSTNADAWGRNVTKEPNPRPSRDDDWFEDVTAKTGIRFTYRNGREADEYTLLETVGGGAALLDFDQDGDLDIFLTGGGQFTGNPLQVKGWPHAFFRNEGNWRFTDDTEHVGLASAGDYSMGCAVGDYNRDGFPDLYVTCYGKDELWKNENGRYFVNVTMEAELNFSGWSTGAAWADYDGDGHLDLYVAGYADWSPETRESWCGDKANQVRDCCGPGVYAGAPDRLFRNRGDGKFDDVTGPAKLQQNGHGLGVLAADLNNDGWIDFYVANDTDPNNLYWGGPALPLQEGATAAGAAFSEFGESEGSMGIDVGDYNHDGTGDVWVTNFENEENSLYRSDGNGLFTHLTMGTGLGAVNRRHVGFGTGFVDFNHDGWDDLYVLNGNVFYHIGIEPHQQQAFVFQNIRGEHFENVTTNAGPYFSIPHAARGAAVGDLDSDGASDLVIVHHNSPVAVLRNRNIPRSWIGVDLRGSPANIDGIGARVVVSFGEQKLVKWRCSGRGYLSNSDHRLLFPLTDVEPATIEVHWPKGHHEVFSNLAPRQFHRLIQGTGRSLSPAPVVAP